MERFTELFFSIPAAAALGGVFLLTCAEASLFFGFLIPGEIAVVLGGVLAARGSVPLLEVIAAAVGGAILGDFIGYWIGRRYGSRFLERHLPQRWPRIRDWLDKRGGPAVFFGRATSDRPDRGRRRAHVRRSISLLERTRRRVLGHRLQFARVLRRRGL